MSSACASLTLEEGSMYDRGVGPGPRGVHERRRRTRARRRVTEALHHSGIDADRTAQLRAILRAAGEGTDTRPLLEVHVAAIRSEVDALEAEVARRSVAERTERSTIRRALELLRRFGHVSCRDFSALEDELRPLLVTWLALEHRWCYAAAGTDRRCFKRAVGRTGAR